MGYVKRGFTLAVWFALVVLCLSKDSKVDKNPIQRRSVVTEVRTLIKKVAQLERQVTVLTAGRNRFLRGRDGRDGRDGCQGPAGPPGESGKDGTNGKTGPVGPRGPPGRSSGGTEFIRWGRRDCPRGANVLYRGWIGGEHYQHIGGGVNYLCMPDTPVYNRFKPGFQSTGRIYQTEYETSNVNVFGRGLHNHDATCVACHVPSRSAHLMIPATNRCPAGWTREYHGYLMTEYYGHKHPRDFICMDHDPKPVPGTQPNRNGALLYAVEGACSAKQCKSYVQGRELTCVVCTK